MVSESILVVDDTPETLRLLTTVLMAANYTVRPADSGSLALASVQAQLPDLVLLDVRMPKMDGFEVCRRLKENPATQSVPVIFLSGATDLDDRLEGFRLGAVDFIGKPFQQVELLARVRTHLELGRLRSGLEAQVEARTAELRLANIKLEQALRLKDEFLATMSHELRTPLTAVLGMSELLNTGTYGPLSPDQAGAVQVVERSGRHLLGLINDILELAQLEAGQIGMEPQRCQVEELVNLIREQVRHSAEKKAIELDLTVEEKTLMVWADPRQLKRMLVNLLDNAIKFTPPGGKVRLAVEGDAVADQLVFQVSDTGMGMAEAELPLLFQPFVQLDGGLNRKHEGTGLGLALVHKWVKMHGGEVRVSSKLGEGSQFTVTLPWGRARHEQ